MVTIKRISEVNYNDYDEVWAIVRSLKYANQRIRHVPELSPSWALFKTYMSMRDKGNWNEETFRTVYVPQFLKEMRGKEQQALLNELFNTTKNICLVCFCVEEWLCHRSIIGGMLQGAGAVVKGLSQDYSYYYDWWKNGVPGTTLEQLKQDDSKHIEEYNKNVVYLYKRDEDGPLFADGVPTVNATGRRPKDLCMYDTKKYNSFVADLTKLLYEEFYVTRGMRRFISGAAQGFDQMFFWAVERMKAVYKLSDVQNVVFVAFEHQESRWAKTGCFSQAEYWLMVKKADQVVVVCEENSIASLFTRNHVMCDNASCCLALYPDEAWKTSKGGTAECMRYARNVCEVLRLDYVIDAAGLKMGNMVPA